MKKKRASKRLSLHRETLHKLEDRRLPEAIGGVTTVGGTCCARSDSCHPPSGPCLTEDIQCN